MSKSSSPQVQTTTSEPPQYLLPYLQGAARDATSLYGQGGTGVVPFSAESEAALQGVTNRAMSGSPINREAQGYATDVLQGAGIGANPFIPQSFQSDQNRFATGINNPFSSGVQSRFAAGSYNPFSAGGYQNPFSTGGYQNQFAGGMIGNPLSQGGANPYLDSIFDQAAQRTQNQLTSEFSRAGRNTVGALPARSQQLNDLATSIYGGAYESDANRRLQALEGDLSRQYGATESNLGRQYGATESNLGRRFSGVEADLGRQYGATESGLGRQYSGLEADLGRQYGATESNLGRQQAGLDRGFNAYMGERGFQQGLIPFSSGLANQDYYDYGQLAGVGAQREALAQQQANQPLDSLNQYLSQLLGFPGGSVTQTTPTERNWLASAAGGAQLGSAFGPWGMLGGGILGGIFG